MRWGLELGRRRKLGWLVEYDGRGKLKRRMTSGWAAATLDVRLDMMPYRWHQRRDHLSHHGLYVWGIADPRVGQSACRIYNDWILERLSGNPRIKGGRHDPHWDLDMAWRKSERIAGEPSIGGILLPLVGTPNGTCPSGSLCGA